MNILITGASGYLGTYLCYELAESEHNVTAFYNKNPLQISGINFIQCDLTDFPQLTKIFNDLKPDVVYHLASVTPTRITIQPENYIELFNKGVTEQLAKLCGENNALLIYTSTDLVYNEGENIREDKSRLNPLTIYAKTKLMGEESVSIYAARYIILRTSLLYGFTRSTYTSFFDLAFSSMKKNKSVKAFYDQYRNPLYIEDAANILSKLPSLYSHNDIINFCGDEYLSRYEMCIKIAEVFGFDGEFIIKTSCGEFKDYPMVKKLGLNNSKLKKLGLTTGTVAENLRKSLKYKP